MRQDTEAPPHVRIHADVDTPDKIVYGLTARQAAILASAAVVCYGLWRTVGASSPVAALVLMFPITAVAALVALGRRDGLPMDAWLLAAVRHRRAPHRAVPAPEGLQAAPDWAPDLPSGAAGPATTVLRLPARAISADGVIDTGVQTAATMVATTTVNIGLRTGDEQWALLGAYGRWLNGLTGPVQIVVSTKRADLGGHAERITATAADQANDALAEAAEDYATFLLELAAGRDPLWRTVTVVCSATAARGAAAEARRRGEQTATALSALGVEARVLDGGAATAVLTAATDPYQYADSSFRRALPQAPVTVPDGSRP